MLVGVFSPQRANPTAKHEQVSQALSYEAYFVILCRGINDKVKALNKHPASLDSSGKVGCPQGGAPGRPPVAQQRSIVIPQALVVTHLVCRPDSWWWWP